MLIESLKRIRRVISRILHQLSLLIFAMAARALPANSEVEYANYKTFMKMCTQARESLGKAVKADETRVEKKGVIIMYKKAISDMAIALKIRSCSCPANKRQEIEDQHEKLSILLDSAHDRLQKLEEIEISGNNTTQHVVIPPPRPRTVQSVSATVISRRPASSEKTTLLKNVNPKYGEEILSTILPTADAKMSTVEGNMAAKIALEESVVLPSLNPKLFTGLRAPCKGILLFGPPGNGKTMLAKAVANECQSTFFNISAASIMSKWVGDGERLVQALFQVARNGQPSIIFIDEVDSMLCERSESENAAARRVKTEFLIQLDGCAGNSNDRVMVLAATNRPFELDEGILRRFPKRIFIDLPDRNSRANMIKRTFDGTNTPTSLSNRDLDYLAKRTEGYSYSDLDSLCRSAALIPLRSISRTIVHKITASQLRPVNLDDFEDALNTVKPSLNEENRQKLLNFARRYAQISE